MLKILSKLGNYPTCLLLLVLISACSRTQKPPGESAAGSTASPEAARVSSEAVVKAVPEPVEITAGGSAKTTVRLTVQTGYHINANPPTYPYLKPTELEINEGEEISVDYVYYPNPIIKKFSFAEKPLRVYEGETALTLSLEAVKTAAKGKRSLPGKLRIQACDDNICYPPGAIAIAIPVLIK
jgi:hypothetical protein